MSASDEQGYSLADQAAAWVPPWLREQSAEPVEAPSEPEPSTAADQPADVVQPPVDTDQPSAAAVEETDVPDAAAESSWPAGPEPVTVVPRQAEPSSLPSVVAPVDEAMPAGAAVSAGDPMLADDVSGTETRPATVGDPEAPVFDKSSGPGSMLASIDDELRAALEAILLVVDQPVTAAVLASALEHPVDRVTAMLECLADDYTATRRGFELRRAAGGWRLYTRPEYATYVERFVLGGQSVRLTQAALETLAVVAYKQPVTRSRVSAIRGVNCDGVIRTLVSRGLIEECGTEPETGAYLYRTTPLFLEKLGLDRVDQLPPLAPFLPDNVEEIADAPR